MVAEILTIYALLHVFGFGVYIGYYDIFSDSDFEDMHLLSKVIAYIIMFIIWPLFWGRYISPYN